MKKQQLSHSCLENKSQLSILDQLLRPKSKIWNVIILLFFIRTSIFGHKSCLSWNYENIVVRSFTPVKLGSIESQYLQTNMKHLVKTIGNSTEQKNCKINVFVDEKCPIEKVLPRFTKNSENQKFVVQKSQLFCCLTNVSAKPLFQIYYLDLHLGPRTKENNIY